MAWDYDIAFPTKLRRDVLLAQYRVQVRKHLEETVLAKYNGDIIGNVRFGDDFIHMRVRFEDADAVYIKAIKKELKAEASLKLLELSADAKNVYYGKFAFNRDTFISTRNPGDAAVDAWVNDHKKVS